MSWKDDIRNPKCTQCALHESAEYVCLMGSGKRKARLMIVGEAPGAREDEQHAAFVGQAGELLTELLAEAGISRDDCYITNAVKCRPPNNATPSRSQVKACIQYLADEITQVQPNVILGVGNTAMQALMGRSGITKYRGKTVRVGSAIALCTFHPAAALRSAHYLPQIRADLQATQRLLQGVSGPRTNTALIKTRGQLKTLIRYLREARVIAFDVETTGLHEWEDDQYVVTLGVSWAEGRAAVIPVHHATGHTPQYLEELKPLLEDTSKKYVAHNGKFDCKWLAKEGVYVPLTFDTMIAAHLLDENRPKGLKPLSQMLLGADDYAEDTKDCFNANLKKLAIYNGKDCDYTLRLYHLFKKELKAAPRSGRLFVKLMMPASDVFTRLEAGGTYIDPERLRVRKAKAEANVAKCEVYMAEFLPKGMKSINYNSPAQVAVWLFEHLKLPILERTKTNAPSTAEGVLLRLQDQHPAVRALLQYRRWAKYCSTYFRPWSERRDHKSRIHPSYRLTGTTTGRLSSAEPNLQQVPRNTFLRGCIGAPRGWRFVEADYSQVELRLAAWMSGERTMMRLLQEGKDLHTNTASEITGKEPDAIDGEDRVIWGKHPNFGLLFGMYPRKYQEYVRDNSGKEIDLETAEAVHSTFHSTYPSLRRWHVRQLRLAHRYGYVVSPMGRTRHLPDVHNSNDSIRMEAERQAINSPVQGMASDLMLFALIRLARQLNPREARVVGSVHDAGLFEIREDTVERIAPIIKATMEDMATVKRVFGPIINVPIIAEVKIGQYWSEGVVFD